MALSALGGCLLQGGVCSRGGVCSQGGVCSWGMSAPRGWVSARGGCLLPGVSAPGGVWSGGVCSGGVYSSMHWGRHPPPVDRILDTHLWKYYLGPTSLRPVNSSLTNFLQVRKLWGNLKNWPLQVHSHERQHLRLHVRDGEIWKIGLYRSIHTSVNVCVCVCVV